MIDVEIYRQSNYPPNFLKVKRFLIGFFKKNGIVNAFCTVSFVNEKVMLSLAKKHYKDNKLHDVFSFVESDVKGWDVKSNRLYLGEIVICFPKVKKDADVENKLLETKVLELIEHSAYHLLGKHHKE